MLLYVSRLSAVSGQYQNKLDSVAQITYYYPWDQRLGILAVLPTGRWILRGIVGI